MNVTFRRIPNIPIGVLPTLFTLGNLVCGFSAIVIASRVGKPLSADVPLDQLLVDFRNVQIAGWLIFAAMVFDALDGHVARLTNAASDFGAQLDSLCDVVSFGVAPGYLLVKMCPDFAMEHYRMVWMIAALIACCAAMRLARFNVELDAEEARIAGEAKQTELSGTSDDTTVREVDHSTFSGLPSPAAAGSIAGFAIIFHSVLCAFGTQENHWGLRCFEIAQIILPFYGILVAVLMVSRLQYPHVVNRLFSGRRRFRDVVRVMLLLFLLLLFRNYAIPLAFFLFAISGPVRYLCQWAWYRKLPDEDIF
ncbi:MAG: CDP-alcohol phosphatidyltransferase family protein [Planctomycetia bacterium]|nr:CDP-alcohol phosphatidyltransferase family protein [Planctomycetia bacterium]